MKKIITGGTIVTAADQYQADLLIEERENHRNWTRYSR